MIDKQPEAYALLADRFSRAGKLNSAQQFLFWDSQTYMPRGGAETRGEQLAALEAASDALILAPDCEDLFDAADRSADRLSAGEAANLAEMRRVWRHRAAVPPALSARKTRIVARLQGQWAQAKQSDDFETFAPGFDELLSLHREIAAAKGEALGLAPYDALMDELDPGLGTAVADPIFARLEGALPSLRQEVLDRQAGWPAPQALEGDFSEIRQRELSHRLYEAVGLDPDHGRIDAAAHPFTAAGSPGDVRITTRFDAGNVRFAVMGTLHESGHALYESNLPREWVFTPAGAPRGATAHESQSLLFEMFAGRSREFLAWLAPQMHAAFGGAATAWSASNLHNLYRRVDPGFIRVEADEISYPLHIILRYRIERALLSGDLAVADLPGAWADLSEGFFGRRPANNAEGCLQDIHWAAGLFGYFPNYSLGQCLAAQLFERAASDDPSILPRLEHGDFTALATWVAPRIHHRASLVDFGRLAADAAGAALSADALLRHLKNRYLEEPAPGG